MEYMESKKERYSSAHAVYSLRYHIVFCPKYRRKVLTPAGRRAEDVFPGEGG